MSIPSAPRDRDFIPVSRPFMWGKEAEYVNQAISEGWVSSRGRMVDAFERGFAEALGVEYAVGVCNGTAAVHLALAALGIKAGDEVIVPDFCMIAPALAILYCGATPVAVDVDETWNMAPALIEEHITERTRAILVVHNYGHPARMDEIADLARRRGLYLVEDTAEALGATVNGQQAGTFGDVASFSFYANKVITTGEGGMVVTRRADLFERLRWKRDLCFGKDEETRYTHAEVGFNYRLTNLQAAVGVAQLEHLDEAIASKVAVARRYDEALRDLPGLTLPPEAAWAKNVYWVYGVLVEPEFGVPRALLQEQLLARGIETRRFFTPLHEQPIVPPQGGASDYPRSAHLAEHGLYLPSSVGMQAAAVERVAETLHALRRQHGGASA
ncbi:MAG TPA: DegT/DnrJ/EryC1/StrS family aminotransferase [Pyrinomonadaceae bacterium]|nr:DegT/DnrJ/EryC1/StrS family aminotransferase [Pyrinomonadaceae bacterium]